MSTVAELRLVIAFETEDTTAQAEEESHNKRAAAFEHVVSGDRPALA